MNTLEMPANRTQRASRTRAVLTKEMVASAADVVSPVWPLKTFIAVNPLQGLEHLPFEKALLEVGRYCVPHGDISSGKERVNREMIKWCSAYFDEGQSTIAMPCRGAGLYKTFSDLARYDRKLNRSKDDSALLNSLPESPEQAIDESLDDLGIAEDQKEEFIRRTLAALPGWSGYVKWKEHWQNPSQPARQPATLVDYVAVRLVLTRLLSPEAGDAGSHTAVAPGYLAELPLREARFRDALLKQLLEKSRAVSSPRTARADAQLVFCIDVRSEPFRRAIEAQGSYETLGFAGFFGVPVRVKGYDEDQPRDSCPVLLKPRHTVCDRPLASVDSARVHRHERGRWLLRTPGSFYQWLKYNFVTPFALVEMLGPWLGLRMLARTFAPSLLSELGEVVRKAVLPPVSTEPSLEGIEVSQRADYAESALRMMGLTENLASLVVLCGHGSSTVNNAYASALDCGACGGKHGGGNARILAAILNSESVRSEVAVRGILIPADTLFLAAEHDTTTDEVELFLPNGLTSAQQDRVTSLRADLAKAGLTNAKIRAAAMGVSNLHGNAAVMETRRRSTDWAELRPEWGLSRNAAFIVGPRELTQGIDLQGRCFLHSYDWKNDADGKFLTAILTAPMVVAQWINSQYLFSTLDNVAFGAGSKVTQNFTGKIGAMQGNASDLMHGLPLQSVYASDGVPHHEPLRLLTIVLAPRATLDAIIRSQDVLKKLFGNGWVNVVCIDPSNSQAYRLNRGMKWQAA